MSPAHCSSGLEHHIESRNEQPARLQQASATEVWYHHTGKKNDAQKFGQKIEKHHAAKNEHWSETDTQRDIEKQSQTETDRDRQINRQTDREMEMREREFASTSQ